MNEKVTLVIKAIRLLKGVKQISIAHALHIQDSYYSRIENGYSQMHIGQLYVIAEHLNVKPRDILALAELSAGANFENDPLNKTINDHILMLSENGQKLAFTIDEMQFIISKIKLFCNKALKLSK